MTYFALHPSEPQFDDDGNPTSALDWLGARFRVGDHVIYCVGAGRGQMTAIGVVTALKGTRVRYPDPNAPYSPGVPRPRIDRIEIEVQVITRATAGRWNNAARSRRAWVNPMNITLLDGLAERATAKITGVAA